MGIFTTIALVVVVGVIASAYVIKATEGMLSQFGGSTVVGVAHSGIVAVFVGALAAVGGLAVSVGA